MTARDKNTIKHILSYCIDVDDAINTFGDSYEIFESNKHYRNSVSMSIMQIGELVKNLSGEFKSNTNAQIPWKDVAGMRDHFAHGYTTMNIQKIWHTALNDIPSLKKFCEEQLERYDTEDPT